ncbi:hypothetical protein FG386_003196 [Cryptosporidium ryanae]|uniref:uncharacterized protein n=1 Tax=Cryptosporidium ryanae TaxID=515981 RepID=UPI00351A44AE|nr:hypothetical protein FG386_003196 [Cryptosporidium ryanae]
MSVLKRNSLVKDNLIDEKVFRTDDVTTISGSKELFNVPCVQIKNVLYTPLQASLIYQSSRIRDFLLKQKTIDINTKNSRGENALVTAISSKAPSNVIRELFNKNIEVSIPKDSSKTSILDYADPSWEGYSELTHMIQKKKSHSLDLKKIDSKKHTELKKDEETTGINIVQKYKLIKERTIDEQKMKSEFSPDLESNNIELNEIPDKSKDNMEQKDTPDIPSKQESTRELLNPTEREVFNPIPNLKQIDTSKIVKEKEVEVNNGGDIIIESNSTHFDEVKRNQSNKVVEDTSEKAKTNQDFKKFITRVQENIRSKEFKTKNQDEIRDGAEEINKKLETNFEASTNGKNESLTERNSFTLSKMKSRSNLTHRNKETKDEKVIDDVDDEYLLLIDHQITESIEMSRQFFNCNFCAGFRPWKTDNN